MDHSLHQLSRSTNSRATPVTYLQSSCSNTAASDFYLNGQIFHSYSTLSRVSQNGTSGTSRMGNFRSQFGVAVVQPTASEAPICRNARDIINSVPKYDITYGSRLSSVQKSTAFARNDGRWPNLGKRDILCFVLSSVVMLKSVKHSDAANVCWKKTQT